MGGGAQDARYVDDDTWLTATGYGLYLLSTGTTILLLIVVRQLVHLDISSDAIEDRHARNRARGDLGDQGGPGRRDE